MIRRINSIVRLVSDARPEFSHFRSYLFIKEPNLFLRGFALDMPPGGCYVCKYMFPLFSKLEFISLTFGYRLEGGYVDMVGRSQSQILDNILSIIDENSNFLVEEDFSEFLSFVDDKRISTEAKKEAIALIETCSDIEPENIVNIVENNRKKYALS